jgi:hypothetical protein
LYWTRWNYNSKQRDTTEAIAFYCRRVSAKCQVGAHKRTLSYVKEEVAFNPVACRMLGKKASTNLCPGHAVTTLKPKVRRRQGFLGMIPPMA